MSTLAITIIAVFVGTAAVCAWAGIVVANMRRDPTRRLAKLSGGKQTDLVTANRLKEEMFQEGTEGLKEVWRGLGISPRMFSKWWQEAELPVAVRWVWLAAGAISLVLVAVAHLFRAPVSTYPL